MTKSLVVLLMTVAHLHNVPGWILVRIAWVESRGNIHAQNSQSKAQGLMQLMPAIRHAHKVTDPWDPEQSATAAAKYLRNMHRRLGSWRLAVGGYNCGEARADRCDSYVRLVYRNKQVQIVDEAQ